MQYKQYQSIRSILAPIAVLICAFNFIICLIDGGFTTGACIYMALYGITLIALCDKEFHISEIIKTKIEEFNNETHTSNREK